MTTTSTSYTFTPIVISADLLTSYLSARSGVGTSTASTATTTAATAPTAPWSKGTTTADLSAAATRVLNGSSFIDPNAAKLDVKTNVPDYKALFALNGGLSALEGLAQAAQADGLSDADRSRLQAKFDQGVQQVLAYVGTSPFKKVTVTPGGSAANVTTASGVKAETDSYVTKPLATGASTDPASALAGGGTFSATITRGSTTTHIDFDLSEIDTNPPSVSDVARYMNGKLEAAGALTRMSVSVTPGADNSVSAGGQSFSLGTAPAQVALSVDGSSLEGISFAPTAAAATPAVYVAQTAAATTATGASAAAQLTLSKIDPSGASGSTPLFSQALPAGVTAVRATATGPDGGVYVLADVAGTTADGQVVKGSSDTALLRYDSNGDLTYTRVLGASSQANGYALSVSPDGKQVAIAGAVTGALDGDSGADASTADSFVSVYNAADGTENWTTRAGGVDDDRPAALAWGADGTLYMAGRTDGGLSGVAAQGGTDAYVQGFDATGARTFATVYGGAGTDAATGLAVTADGALVTAGVESGHAVLRRFDPPFSDGAAPSATRDLGDLGGGSISGLGLAPDGSLLVAGAASGGLALGTTTQAYSGGREVFAARVSADLQPGAGDAGAWWTPPAGQDPTVAAASVQGGQVYVTGSTTGAPLDGTTVSTQSGFAVSLDVDAAQPSWAKTFTSADGQDLPSAIAVDGAGVSTLDKLGLPAGALTFAGAADLVSNTTLRPGDSFKIAVGSGSAVTVSINADDTLQTLADRIGEATGNRAAATVVTTNGYAQLKIAPASSSSTLTLSAGPAGSDALAALGLSPTLVTTATSTTKAPTAAPYALGLTGKTLSLADAASAKAAFQVIAGAVVATRKAYSDLATPPASTTAAAPLSAADQAKLANYQLALARLTAYTSGS